MQYKVPDKLLHQMFNKIYVYIGNLQTFVNRLSEFANHFNDQYKNNNTGEPTSRSTLLSYKFQNTTNILQLGFQNLSNKIFFVKFYKFFARSLTFLDQFLKYANVLKINFKNITLIALFPSWILPYYFCRVLFVPIILIHDYHEMYYYYLQFLFL